MLGRLSMTVEECLEAYETLSVKAFGKPRRFHFKNCWIPRNKYDHGPLEDAIREVVELRCGQANAILNQPKKDMCRTYVQFTNQFIPLLILPSIIVAWKESYNEIERRPYLFRSYRHPAGGGYPEERNPDGRTEYPIWQVARATSACPPYFKSMALEGKKNEDYRFVDGGLGANNPSEEAWGSVRQLNQDRLDTVQVLLSVGTGHRIGSKRCPDTFYNKMRSLFDTAKDFVTDTFRVHESVMKQMRSNGHYCRLTARGIEKIKLDTCEGKGGEETFALMRKETDAYLKTADVKTEIQECARKLVAIRRARSGSWDLDRWERYCYGVEYACSLGDCNYSEKRFKRQKLHQHMNESHNGKFDPDHIESLLDQSKKFPLYEPT